MTIAIIIRTDITVFFFFFFFFKIIFKFLKKQNTNVYAYCTITIILLWAMKYIFGSISLFLVKYFFFFFFRLILFLIFFFFFKTSFWFTYLRCIHSIILHWNHFIKRFMDRHWKVAFTFIKKNNNSLLN